MNNVHIKNIALFRLSAIGDVVMMVPVVRALQRHYPAATITWITSKLAYTILEGLSQTDFLVIDKPHSVSSFFKVCKILRKQSYDVLLATQASLRVNLLYPFIKSPRTIGFDKKRARDGQSIFVNAHIDFAREHLLDSFMQFAKVLGVKDTELVWNLPIYAEHYAFAEKQLSVKRGPWLALNPMASKMERNWLPERYVMLLNKIVEKWKVNIVLTGGMGVQEKKYSDFIADKVKADCLVLTGRTTLKQMAALLAKVNVLVAPDTGPAHIASAMGTPVVGLYAVASPELSAPYLSQHLVVNKYPDAVESILKENPETVAWGKRVHSPDAMKLIEVDDVMKKIAEVL